MSIFSKAKKAVTEGKVGDLILSEMKGNIILKPIKEGRLVFHGEDSITYTDRVGNLYQLTFEGYAKMVLDRVAQKDTRILAHIKLEDIKAILTEEYKKAGKVNG